MLEIVSLRYNIILEDKLKGELENLDLKGEVEAKGSRLRVVSMLNGLLRQLS